MADIDVGILVTATNQASGVMRSLRGDVEGVGFAATATANRLKAIQVVLAGIALQKITELTSRTLDTANATEQLQTRLGLLTGDLQGAGRAIQEINKHYGELGVNGDALAEQFVRLREVGVGEEEARKLVDTIGKASAEFDRSADGVQRFGDLLTRVMSKGVLDSKTAITQIVEQFPGLASKLASALGATSVREFVNMAKAGDIAAGSFIQAWNKAFTNSNIFDITQGQISAGLNKLKSVFPDFIARLNLDAALGSQINQRLSSLANSIEQFLNKIDGQSVNTFFNTLDAGGKTIMNLISGFGKLGEAISNGFSGFDADVGKIIENTINKLNSAGAAAGGLVGLVLFGKTGAVAGAVIGGEVDSIFSGFGLSISRAISDLQSHLLGFGAGAFGAIGLFFFGPAGLAVGTIVGATIDTLMDKLFNGDRSGALEQATKNYSQAIQNVQNVIRNSNKDLTGQDDIWKMIVGRAKAYGLTVEQTAAILASAKRESNFDPAAVGDNGHSFGLFQFNDKGELAGLQKFADNLGVFWGDARVQIDYTIQRMKELGLANTSTAESAAKVAANFERFKGFNDPFSSEAAARQKQTAIYTEQLKQQLAVQQQVNDASRAPVTANNEKLTSEQQEKINALTLALASAKKAAADFYNEFHADTPQRMADQAKDRFEQVESSLKKATDAAENYAKKLDEAGQHEAANAFRAAVGLDQQKQLLAAIGQEKDKDIQRQYTLGQLQNQALLGQQALLALKAREAELNLQLNYSNNALFNLLGGTSGGQILLQTEREKITLQQQEVQYTQQIIQLTAQLAQTNNAELAQSIRDNIQLYEQLRAKTAAALGGLSAEAVAQRQLWQSVGSTLENSLVSGLAAVITHTGDWKQATLQAYNAITQAALKYLLQLLEIKALMPLLKGMGIGPGFTGLFGGLFANGGVFPGGVKMFANGGIIGGPTLFGMAGEAGTEAIMPLEQVGGKLGVRATGGGGDHLHVSIQAIDTQTGVEFLLKNIQTIQQGLTHRKALNRGQRVGAGA